MIFEQHLLEDNLKKNIESIFYYKDFMPQHSIERVVPTGHVFLIIELDGIERQTFESENLSVNGRYLNAWVSGMHKDYLSISTYPKTEMLVVQFKALGAFPYFGFPLIDIYNKVVSAEVLFGESILQLRKYIINSPQIIEKFRTVEHWLESKFNHENIPSKNLVSIVNDFEDKPISEHKEIVNTYSKTQKHLIDQFKKYCGLTPKIYHRIMRFNEILVLIKNQEKVKWSQIAYLCGYADQSHFIKEFKLFSGFNPQEFINNKYQDDEPNFFPLNNK